MRDASLFSACEKIAPRKLVAHVKSERADEFALGAAVSFAKGMDCIEFAEVVAGTLGEAIRV
jgi:hypothetical protein